MRKGSVGVVGGNKGVEIDGLCVLFHSILVLLVWGGEREEQRLASSCQDVSTQVQRAFDRTCKEGVGLLFDGVGPGSDLFRDQSRHG